MTLSLAEIATATGAPPLASQGAATGYSIDSRTVAPGDLFFAFRGEKNDAHQYLGQVFERGAAAAVVEDANTGFERVFPVGSTQAGLEQLARHARARFTGEVVGITGSAGKTTTKDTVASLLGSAFRVGKTTGNYNNHVGLPLSLLRVPDDAGIAVLELGMNHAGEIRHLAGIARPSIAVITNVGYAHIENFDGIDGIALAKRELVESLPRTGVAVLNADDPRVARFAQIHPGRTVTYGIESDADVRAEEVSYLEDGVQFRLQDQTFRSRLAGRHQVLNILAGIAVAGLFGIAPARLREAVSALAPAPMRGERLVTRGITVWNDCYNANPDAVRGMLDLLRDTPATRRIAVLGEMLELGRWAEPLHRDIGVYAAQAGVSVLVGIRGAARFLVEAARQSGLEAGAAYFFETPEEAGEFVRGLAHQGDAILFKGSRGTRVEKALERFLA